jgi:hypothetical protein
MSFPNWFSNSSYKSFGCVKKSFQLILKLASPKTFDYEGKWFQKEFSTWITKVSKLYREKASLPKIDLRKQNFLPLLFIKNDLLHSKGFCENRFPKALFKVS